jgi:hypothetical protein
MGLLVFRALKTFDQIFVSLVCCTSSAMATYLCDLTFIAECIAGNGQNDDGATQQLLEKCVHPNLIEQGVQDGKDQNTGQGTRHTTFTA